MDKFKIGDRVSVDFSKASQSQPMCKDGGVTKRYNGIQEGVIKFIRKNTQTFRHLIEFDSRFADDLHNGKSDFTLGSDRGWYVPEEAMTISETTLPEGTFRYKLGNQVSFADGEVSGIGKIIGFYQESYIIESDSITSDLATEMYDHEWNGSYLPHDKNKIRLFESSEISKDIFKIPHDLSQFKFKINDEIKTNYGMAPIVAYGYRKSYPNKYWYIVRHGNGGDIGPDMEVISGCAGAHNIYISLDEAHSKNIPEEISLGGFTLGEVVSFKDSHCEGIGRIVAIRNTDWANNNKLVIESDAIKLKDRMDLGSKLLGAIHHDPAKIRAFTLSEVSKLILLDDSSGSMTSGVDSTPLPDWVDPVFKLGTKVKYKDNYTEGTGRIVGYDEDKFYYVESDELKRASDLSHIRLIGPRLKHDPGQCRIFRRNEINLLLVSPGVSTRDTGTINAKIVEDYLTSKGPDIVVVDHDFKFRGGLAREIPLATNNDLLQSPVILNKVNKVKRIIITDQF